MNSPLKAKQPVSAAVSLNPLAPSFLLLAGFAQAAMEGMMSCPNWGESSTNASIAVDAWSQADAMLTAMPQGMRTRLREADVAWAAATGAKV